MDSIYVVLDDFEGAADGDLSLTAGTQVKVIDGNEPGWWVVETAEGAQGIFPSNFLGPLSDFLTSAADSDDNSSPAQSPVPIVSTNSAVDELLKTSKKSSEQQSEQNLLVTDEGDQQDDAKNKQLTAEEKRERYRNEVIGEILNTEADYVKDLDIIVRVFLGPIRERDIVPRAEITNLFSNVEAIMSVNRELLNSLATHRSDAIFMVGAVFLKTIEFLKMYTIYCSNQPVALSALERLKSPTFDAFLDERMKLEECRGLTLFSFLIKPIQRICKYPLLLKDLLRNTSTDHPDYGNIQQALSKIEEVVAYVNERKRLAENLQKILEVQESITSDFDLGLVEPSRRFCREGIVSLLIKGKPHERKIYLFNDLILFTRPKKSVIGTVRDYFVAKFLLKDVRFIDIADTDEVKDVCEFSSKNSQDKVLVGFSNIEEKRDWVKEIKALMKEFQKKEFLAKREELKREAASPSPAASPQPQQREKEHKDLKELKETAKETKELPVRKLSAAASPALGASPDLSPTPPRALPNVGKLEIPKGIKVQVALAAKDDKKNKTKEEKKNKEKQKDFDKKVRSGSVETVESSVVKASQLDNDFRKNLQSIMAQKK